jgi:transcriptional regulator with XRE-family HTH domain
VRRVIEELETKYGSLRRAAREVGTSRQNLMNWREGGKNQAFIVTLERIRKALKISKARMWSLMCDEEE